MAKTHSGGDADPAADPALVGTDPSKDPAFVGDRRGDPRRFREGDTTKVARVVAWLQRSAPRSWTLAMYFAVFLGLIFAVYQLSADSATSRHFRRDENATCKIQARGLPADKQLAQVLSLFYRAETLPKTPAERAAAKHQDPRLAAINAGIKYHLFQYLYYENKQPGGRACGQLG